MKALSTKQPFAIALVDARYGKDVENRDWLGAPGLLRQARALIGQRLAIHASASWYGHGADEFVRRVSGRPIRRADCPMSAIVGTAVLADVVTNSASPWFIGDVGLVFRDPVLLPEPVPCKGALGFWIVPADVEARVLAGAVA